MQTLFLLRLQSLSIDIFLKVLVNFGGQICLKLFALTNQYYETLEKLQKSQILALGAPCMLYILR